MPVFRIHYRRLIAYFSDPLQEIIACVLDPFYLAISAESSILDLQEGFDKIFSLSIMFRKVISLIHEEFFFGDRVPLKAF